MNDSEIIELLETCGEIANCKKCSFYNAEKNNCLIKLNTYALDLIKRQQAEIEKLKSIQLKQGNIIDSLRGDKYECIGTIDAFKKKFELADETINQIEDALDRGVDNSGAREHIDEYRE